MPGKITVTFFFLCLIGASGCTKSETPSPNTAAPAEHTSNTDAHNIGVGPVSSLKLENEIQHALVASGEKLFTNKCAACHKMEEKYVGPALKGVTIRRQPEWIMNMILNPQEMTQKDPTAQELLGEYLTQMPFQNITQAEVRSILEYFRSVDHK